jgi:hypothetical protein
MSGGGEFRGFDRNAAIVHKNSNLITAEIMNYYQNILIKAVLITVSSIKV